MKDAEERYARNIGERISKITREIGEIEALENSLTPIINDLEVKRDQLRTELKSQLDRLNTLISN